jgi:hypothetical protein
MLKISPDAIEALRQAGERNYILRLGEVVRAALPDLRDEPDATLYPQLQSLVEQARGFGLGSERAVACYVMTGALLGIDFSERFAGAREILTSKDSEERKAELLEGFTVTLFQTLER